MNDTIILRRVNRAVAKMNYNNILVLRMCLECQVGGKTTFDFQNSKNVPRLVIGNTYWHISYVYE